ncbi:hypothetical protein FG183_11595 [Serratia marcescens subsp. marcescens ATCC 13880]|nr:hypothetical protein FG183_11595 [Serratia marcescens subsp. marcescens ATCC 13880]
MTKLAMLHESLIPFVAKKTGSQLLWHNALSPAEQDELKKRPAISSKKIIAMLFLMTVRRA